MNNYYVYYLSDPETNDIFYVGMAKVAKGCCLGYRARQHINEAIRFKDRGILSKGANKHKIHKIIKIIDTGALPSIVILQQDISKEDAIDLEIKEISRLGRKDLGTGLLTNLTKGGEGASGMSDEGRKRISEAIKERDRRNHPTRGRKLGKYDAERVRNAAEASRIAVSNLPSRKGEKRKPLSEEHKQKISDSMIGRPSPMKGKASPLKGRPLSDDTKAKLSAGAKGRPSPTKGKSTINKGKTYAEIYGEEKAAELLRKRKLSKQKYWAEKNNNPRND